MWLFPLQYRGKALALLLMRLQRRMHVREIARLTGTVAGTMNQELDRPARAGCLEKHRIENQLHFCANPRHLVFPDLSALLLKTNGRAEVLALALTMVMDRIAVTFVFGFVARASVTEASDVDIRIIGDTEFGEAVYLLYEAQNTQQREINPKIFTMEPWLAKLTLKRSFVLDVLAKPKVFLIGAQRDLDQLAEPGQDRPA